MNRALLVPTIFLLLAASACERQRPPVSFEDIRSEEGPDQESWNPDMVITEDGLPRMRLRAAYMAYFDRGDSTFMQMTGLPDGPGDRVLVEIFNAEGDTTATVEADEVFYFDRNRRMEARGRVVVVTNTGRRLESEHLEWDEFGRTIRTPGFARITMPDRRLQGYGLEADEDLVDVRLRDITGVVYEEVQ